MTTEAADNAQLREYLLLPHGVNANLYVRELARAYRALGVHVVLGADNLAELSHPPRWLHLQWPEEHYRWTGTGGPSQRAEAFVAKLRWLKACGTRIAWTVHNLAPHEHGSDALDQMVYQTVIELADVLVHHCACSVELLKQRYPAAVGKTCVVSPHGHFMAYPQGATREQSRRRLGLPADAVVFLQFGQVRAYKGLDTLLNAFARLRHPKKHLLVAGRYSAPTGRRSLLDRLRMAWLKRLSPRITLHLHEIGNDDVQLYMAAADVLVLTHRAGLNSGVAVLGMSFGKIVVAPDIGCVSEALQGGDNLVYPADDLPRLVQAMAAAAGADASRAVERHRAIAAQWRWEDTAEQVMRQLRAADRVPR